MKAPACAPSQKPPGEASAFNKPEPEITMIGIFLFPFLITPS